MPENKDLLLTTFSDLSKLLDQFPLADSVHVSLSWALPQAFAFLDNPHPGYIGWNLLVFCTRAYQGFPRSGSSFVAALGWYSTPGYLRVRASPPQRGLAFCERRRKIAHPSPFPFWIRPINPRWGPAQRYDASNIPFLRSHDSQLAGVTASDLRLTRVLARFPD